MASTRFVSIEYAMSVSSGNIRDGELAAAGSKTGAGFLNEYDQHRFGKNT